MATVFKSLNNDDIAVSKTNLYEAVPITGSLISGSYSNTNIKDFSHGRNQDVYDYNYNSASANLLFSLSAGYSSGSTLSTSSNPDHSKKRAMYDSMAQTLFGYNSSNKILRFDQDGNITEGGTKIDEAYFVSMSRLLTKDGIKKGSVSITFGGADDFENPYSGDSGSLIYTDAAATSSYFTNAAAGNYAQLLSGSVVGGLVFYDAGVIVVDAVTVFSSSAPITSLAPSMSSETALTTKDVRYAVSGTTIQNNCDVFRRRLGYVQFNNKTELNSTIYFCRLSHNDFNYSSNPTYTSGSKLVVKNVSQDAPVSYATGIGLYSASGELLVVAKLSEPLKKDPSTEIVLRVRSDW